MKSRMTRAILMIIVLIAGVSLAFQKPWSVPDKYSKMPNPVKVDAASANTGKAIWAKHCQSCHGKTGKGDGSKSAGLKTHPGDFSTPAIQGQSDGSLFYKISEGRDEMPGFKKKIPDEEELWSVINYMRTFKK